MKTLVLIFVFTITLQYYNCKSATLMIIDSVEIKKAITANKINQELVKQEKYIPINNIDKNFVENLIFYNVVLNVCKRVEQEVNEEKGKEFIIIDTPPLKNSVNSFDNYFPFG